MKTRTKLGLVAILIGILATAVYAAMIAHWDIQTSLRIKRTVSIGVFDTDGVTPLTALNLGDFTWENGKVFPGGTWPPPPSQFFFVKNVDQTDFYVGYTVDPIIEGVTFRLFICRGDKTEWRELSTPGVSIYEYPLISSINNPDPSVQSASWYLYVYVANGAAFGDYNPVLTVTAHDSATG